MVIYCKPQTSESTHRICNAAVNIPHFPSVCSNCREEADRLIEILRSSVVDNGVDTKKAAAANLEVKSSTPNMLHGTRLQANEAQPSNSLQSDEQRLREELRKNWQEQKLNFWPHGFGKENGTPPARGTEVRSTPPPNKFCTFSVSSK